MRGGRGRAVKGHHRTQVSKAHSLLTLWGFKSTVGTWKGGGNTPENPDRAGLRGEPDIAELFPPSPLFLNLHPPPKSLEIDQWVLGRWVVAEKSLQEILPASSLESYEGGCSAISRTILI